MGTEPNLTRLDRLFARLDREQQRPEQLHVPRMSSTGSRCSARRWRSTPPSSWP
ncbi:hypothetical protein ACFQVA_06810 [Actinomadura keratinilytica]